MYVLGYPLLAVVQIVNSILFGLTLLIFAHVIITWVAPYNRHPIVMMIHRIAWVCLHPIQRRVGVWNGIDLSPIILLILIAFIRIGVLPIFANFAASLV